MPTTAQRFYLGAVDDDQAYGTTIKKNLESAPAANSATTCTWSATGAQTRTKIPLAGTTTASDTSSDNGWGFNNGGADGLGSATGAERWIKAGVWNFSVSYTLNAPALLATIACTVTARVYRVASGGGARTLLFTAASANFSATGVVTWSSAAQPEYVLGPGETIHVGFTAVSAATNNAITGTVATVLTTNLGADTWFEVPSPGVRTLARADYALTGAGTLAGAASRVLGTVGSLAGSGTLVGTVTARFAGVFALTGSGTANVAGSSVAGTVFALSGSTALTGRLTRILSARYDMSTAPPGADPDYPVVTATKAIAGVVRNHETGATVEGVTVRLFRTSDELLCQVTTTAADGSYSFVRDAADPYLYYVTAQHDAGGGQVHGISDRGVAPE